MKLHLHISLTSLVWIIVISLWLFAGDEDLYDHILWALK